MADTSHQDLMRFEQGRILVASLQDAVDSFKESAPTLRDRFAMAALNGIMSHPDTKLVTPGDMSDVAYLMADAMLAARATAAAKGEG